jgi:hypothetical protein
MPSPPTRRRAVPRSAALRDDHERGIQDHVSEAPAFAPALPGVEREALGGEPLHVPSYGRASASICVGRSPFYKDIEHAPLIALDGRARCAAMINSRWQREKDQDAGPSATSPPPQRPHRRSSRCSPRASAGSHSAASLRRGPQLSGPVRAEPGFGGPADHRCLDRPRQGHDVTLSSGSSTGRRPRRAGLRPSCARRIASQRNSSG